MNRLIYTCSVLVLFMAAAPVRPAPITNLQVLETAYFDLVHTLLQSVDISDTSAVLEKPEVTTSHNWLIEKQIVAALNAAGVHTIFTKDEKNTLRFNYKPIDHYISYEKIAKKQIKRRIDVALYVRLQNSKSTILKDHIINTSIVDSLAAKDIKYVENPNLLFTIGRRQNSIFKKIYEPFVVIVVTGWIIYLFYSYRSQ